MKKVYLKSDFKAIFFLLNLQQIGKSNKGFLPTSKVCPQGVVCPCPGAIYIYIIIKNVNKKQIFLNLQRMGKVIRAFCWHQHLSPRGCLPLPWAIYIYKNIEIYTRTRYQVSVYRTTGPIVYFSLRIILKVLILNSYHRKYQNTYVIAKWCISLSVSEKCL